MVLKIIIVSMILAPCLPVLADSVSENYLHYYQKYPRPTTQAIIEKVLSSQSSQPPFQTSYETDARRLQFKEALAAPIYAKPASWSCTVDSLNSRKVEISLQGEYHIDPIFMLTRDAEAILASQNKSKFLLDVDSRRFCLPNC